MGSYIIFLWLIFFWGSFRWFVFVGNKAEQCRTYNRKRYLHPVYSFFAAVFLMMMVLYSFFPHVYSIFVPIKKLDHPVINSIGVLIIKISFIWLIISKIILDKRIMLYSKDAGNPSHMMKVHMAEDKTIKGLLLMFIGVFVTISNFAGILLCLASLVFYMYSRKKNITYS